MKVTKVYPNGNFRCSDTKKYKDGEVVSEFDVAQIAHRKEVKVGDEINFTDKTFKTIKFTKDGKQQSKVIIVSLGFEIVSRI